MPLYEYACDSCGAHTEIMQRVGAPPLAACPTCGGPVHKVLAAPALQFKGSGWYVTDYGRGGNGSRNTAASEKDKAPASDGGKSTGSGENKAS
jgi:putative FmdB family regulatory protein